MGQYYMPYLKDREGNERKFNPQNAIYRTLKDTDEDFGYGTENGRPADYYDYFSGLKLMEHSWLENDFVNGVLEAIWDNPCQVAWVGDCASDTDDFDGRYTPEVYAAIWGEDGLPESRFEQMPETHRDGYLVNVELGRYVDLAEYAEVATYKPKWAKDGGWCIHPLPLLTAIGNGRGGGGYHGEHMEMVGAWAMDEIAYTQDAAKVAFLEKLDVSGIAFREED